MGSRASKEQSITRNIFPDRSGDNFYIQGLPDFGVYGQVIIKSKGGSNMLQESIFEEVREIDTYIRKDIAVSNGLDSYEDLCALYMSKCAVIGDIIFGNDFTEKMQKGNIPYPIYKKWALSSVFGNLTHENGYLSSATMVKLRYYLRTDTEDNKQKSLEWEKEFLAKMEGVDKNLTEIAYENSDSLNTELDGNTGRDVGLFSFTFTIMLTYAGLQRREEIVCHKDLT